MMAPAVAGWVVNIDAPRSVSVRVWGLPSGVTGSSNGSGRPLSCLWARAFLYLEEAKKCVGLLSFSSPR